MNYGTYKEGRIITKKSAKLMQTVNREEDQYGFGLEISKNLVEGVRLVGHNGAAYGLYSAMYFDPKKKFGIVVISNGCDPTNQGGYNKVVKRAVNVLYDNLIAKP
jgi:CubicO group peptidase (beta-lactamase class C family)